MQKFDDNGRTLVSKEELLEYYSTKKKRETNWKKELGDDLNWSLSFDNISESERTKHVHRLHPYKGKFIPQLVEYFLDSHTDEFKQEEFFFQGGLILDPFCGSGTTLVQANELGIHAIGIDISEFNALVSNVKVSSHNLFEVQKSVDRISRRLREYIVKHKWEEFETELSNMLSDFNSTHFPSPEYKRRARRKDFDNKTYEKEREQEFIEKYIELENKYTFPIEQESIETFLDTWYVYSIRQEIEIVRQAITEIKDQDIRDILTVILRNEARIGSAFKQKDGYHIFSSAEFVSTSSLSRTIRTCRATTHFDLATLKSPVTKPYFCRKHYKICKPLYSMYKWWERYTQDTIQRFQKFSELRTDTWQHCLVGDSRQIDIINQLGKYNQRLAHLVEIQGIHGIFSSPPYVGLIDYHEQHAYAYEAFDYVRRDRHEIGSQSSGRSASAREEYVQGIASVLNHCKQYLVDDYDVFLVANDNYDLYPRIAKTSGMQIVSRFKRPVLHRSEHNKNPYSETIFHLKELTFSEDL